MPRRRPAQLRTEALSRLRRSKPSHPSGLDRIERLSNLPGMSPLGRKVIARLENTRLWPGQIEEAIDHWERFVHDPAHRLYDQRYEGCGIWECCPAMYEVRDLLTIVERNLPRRDARRLNARLAALDEFW